MADDDAQRFGGPVPVRLPSEDVVVSAPMSYTGSAQRIVKLRRLARDDRELTTLSVATVTLIAVAWAIITVWYLMWGIVLLIPYRVLRRRARQRRVEQLRHRELLQSIGHPRAASAPHPPAVDRSGERVGDVDRERVAGTLRNHMLGGRLTTEEFEERLDAAHRARTRGDLGALLADLPRGAPADRVAARGADWARPPRWPDPSL